MSLANILQSLTAAPNQTTAIGALVSGLVNVFAPSNPAIAATQALLSQLQMSLSDAASVARVAGAIQANSGNLYVVGLLAGQLATYASGPNPDQNHINLLASEVAAAINAASSGSSQIASLNFLAPTLASQIAAKPV